MPEPKHRNDGLSREYTTTVQPGKAWRDAMKMLREQDDGWVKFDELRLCMETGDTNRKTSA